MIKQKTICKQLGITYYTLNIYLCRAEFSHIKKIKQDKTVYYEGITAADIDKLRKLTGDRYHRNNVYDSKSKINELNLLKGQNKQLLEQNKSLQKENAELRKLLDKK